MLNILKEVERSQTKEVTDVELEVAEIGNRLVEENCKIAKRSQDNEKITVKLYVPFATGFFRAGFDWAGFFFMAFVGTP